MGLLVDFSRHHVASTDPPYYDNIGYADPSDFFYVWLRRSLKPVFPDLFATLAVPKAEELVATPYRHGSKDAAETFFLNGMTLAMRRLSEQAHPGFPVTIYYAFKQSETKDETGAARLRPSPSPDFRHRLVTMRYNRVFCMLESLHGDVRGGRPSAPETWRDAKIGHLLPVDPDHHF